MLVLQECYGDEAKVTISSLAITDLETQICNSD